MPQSLVFALILLGSTEWLAAHCQREEATQMSNHNSNPGTEESRTQLHQRTHAEAKITVHNSEAKPFDPPAKPALMEITLSETFVGDIDGESSVRAVQVLRDDHSSSMVSMQRFRGKLAGRKGTFVLQGTESVENGTIRASWFVVPGSGTGDFSG